MQCNFFPSINNLFEFLQDNVFSKILYNILKITINFTNKQIICNISLLFLPLLLLLLLIF